MFLPHNLRAKRGETWLPSDITPFGWLTREHTLLGAKVTSFAIKMS